MPKGGSYTKSFLEQERDNWRKEVKNGYVIINVEGAGYICEVNTDIISEGTMLKVVGSVRKQVIRHDE